MHCKSVLFQVLSCCCRIVEPFAEKKWWSSQHKVKMSLFTIKILIYKWLNIFSRIRPHLNITQSHKIWKEWKQQSILCKKNSVNNIARVLNEGLLIVAIPCRNMHHLLELFTSTPTDISESWCNLICILMIARRKSGNARWHRESLRIHIEVITVSFLMPFSPLVSPSS